MEFLTSAVSAVVPLVVNTICQHMVYPFTAGGNIRALKSATTDLQALKEDVNTEITNAERVNDGPTNQAKEWLHQVEAIEKEAEEIQQRYQQLCRCVCNIAPNFCAIYEVSRSAAEKHVEVKSLSDKKATLEVTVRMPPPLAQEMPASSSKSSNLESALHYIKNDVGNNIIGIWGMGGVGKTHLLEQINNELSGDPSFKVVIFVTCSNECSEEKVQDKIIDKLGLSKRDTMVQKQSTIYNFLREKSFVLLLDDLWNRVDLKTVGIPDPMKEVGVCKRSVVLTTRSTEVCGQMEVKRNIRVNVLNSDDAWCLFKQKVTEEIIDSNPLIKKYAMDVVKELSGLPLALITIGRAMHDKKHPSEWERAVKLLKQAHLNDLEFSGSDPSIFHTLKFSYDNLKEDKLKECFLHCSLFPEDYQFRKDNLVEIWMGLGLIDESNIQDAYDVGYWYIGRLQAVCLLEIGDNYTGTIKMHDVIRDMALWIANNHGKDGNKWIVKRCEEKEIEIEVFGDTEKLSMMNNYAKKVSIFITCSSAKLSTLLLRQNSIEDPKTLRLEFFSKLTFLDLSNSLRAFPVEICKLVHLQYLDLSWNGSLEIPEELGALINLKYLFLRHTSSSFANKVFSRLKSLKVLDVCGSLSPPESLNFLVLQEDLQCLPDFKALAFSIPHFSTLDFNEFSRKVSVPIRCLEVSECTGSCLSFSSCLMNSHLQNNLISISLHMHNVKCVQFESTSENRYKCHLGRLETLNFYMPKMREVVWKNLNPKDVFPRLQSVLFSNCPKLTSISWIVNLPCIGKLVVHDCREIKQLIRIDELESSGIEVSQHSFPCLKIMVLKENYDLERISDPMITFPVLEFLGVSQCYKLKEVPIRPDKLPIRPNIEEEEEEEE
ncbi:hypothetical protein LUZ61_007366 [Rhynchospora tenuis]|uniref:AAA+ ATPase domain-containing protein n=1 Tax=Rhynchospora tenuis TaxID=198213 RepID=A0AAD6EWG2_9POAL|nr:hypothetical protein LUZ61_007366 [Rhynchospora tenuis]